MFWYHLVSVLSKEVPRETEKPVASVTTTSTKVRVLVSHYSSENIPYSQNPSAKVHDGSTHVCISCKAPKMNFRAALSNLCSVIIYYIDIINEAF